ncbi:venom allergen 5-like [Microplitis mediator]|uniref:venom allergen 5-like n=1 Tax=Microplitis mediator TaxID=375433 RepID=UPI002556A315|nr:venom allergen 5-like [Microplitis mediator]
MLIGPMIKSPVPAASCGKVISITLTQAEINEILKVHNDGRALVASGCEKRGNPGPQPAGVIPPLKWDSELAQVAQRWAIQCKFGHDRCRDVLSIKQNIAERFQVGQNVAFQTNSRGHEEKLAELVKTWYDEVMGFNSSKVENYPFDLSAGHYTQLVWGDTTIVGCGAIRYMGRNKWYSTYLVCNYGPTGNWIGQPVYQTS